MTSAVRSSSRVDSTDFAHTGPGTLAGRYLRRFWQPVLVSSDLPPGTAKPVRVMNEEFTLYRGEIGIPHLVGHRCAHRGTQLSSGWVEDDCIRCLYHGWKYDPMGQCVEQPGEEGGTGFADKVQIPSFPIREHLGLLFAYLGGGDAPTFPPFPAFTTEGVLETFAVLFPCNYFQSYENTTDEFHVAYVHSGGGTHRRLADVPKMFAEETNYGLIRRSVRPDGKVRVTQHLMPNITRVLIPAFKGMRGVGGWRDAYIILVPNDDQSHTIFLTQLAAVPPAEMSEYETIRQQFLRDLADSAPVQALAQEVLAGSRRLAEVSEHPWGVNIEDIVAQAGQGTIADRSNERLGRTDVGVIQLRKLWSRELRALAEGAPLKEWRYQGEAPELGF